MMAAKNDKFVFFEAWGEIESGTPYL